MQIFPNNTRDLDLQSRLAGLNSWVCPFCNGCTCWTPGVGEMVCTVTGGRVPADHHKRTPAWLASELERIGIY